MAGLNYPGVATPSGEDVFNLTSAPNGGWTISNHPRAVRYNGVNYSSFVHSSTGSIYVMAYDDAGAIVAAPILIATMAGGPNTHVAPPLLVRDSDHKLMVAFCLHGGPGLFYRLSNTSLDTDPDLSDGFAAAVNIDSSVGASNYAFPNIFQLTGVTNDPIYIFYRDDSSGTGRLAFTKSSDNGATWSARTLVMTPPISTNQLGWAIRATTTRVDVLSSDRNVYGPEGAVDIGHMYMDGTDDSWHKSDGTLISATKPFAHSELTQVETNVVGGFPQDGIAGANPIFTYFVDNGDSTITAKYARWDGSSWDKASIYTEAHFTLDRYYGGLVINRADSEEVFSGISTGAGTSELYTYTSADLGATWDSGTAITSGSGDLNAAPTTIENGVADMPLIWLRGTISSSNDFSFGIKGLRR